jgi:hypothetical protein
MEEVLRTSNPGLARRFRPDDAFHFDDYNDEQLRHILLSKAASAGLAVPADAADAAIALLARQRQKPHFGNGGAVENLLNRAKECLSARIGAAVDAGAPLPPDERSSLLPSDFLREPLAAPEDALAHLIGAEAARDKLEELRAAVASAQAEGRDPWSSVESCFVIKGPPGCASSTHRDASAVLLLPPRSALTRPLRMRLQFWQDQPRSRHGRPLPLSGPPRGAGRRRKDSVHAPNRLRRTGGRQAARVLDEALGRVLLIDEAHTLGASRGTFNDEIVSELAACLTSAKYANRLVVVLAGCEDEVRVWEPWLCPGSLAFCIMLTRHPFLTGKQMNHFLARTNPGLASRFSEQLTLPAFSVSHAAALGARRAAECGRPLTRRGGAAMLRACTDLAAAPGWASGRDVDTLVKRAARKAALRARGDAAAGSEATLDADDVDAAAAEMMAQPCRDAAAASAVPHHAHEDGPFGPFGPLGGGGSRPPLRPSARPRGGAVTPTATATAQRTEAATATAGGDDGGDAGDDALWSCLERACVACGLSAAETLPELRAGRAPERVVPHVAAELGRSAGEVRDMLGAQAPALARKVEASLAKAAELEKLARIAAAQAAADAARTRNRTWVCGYCANSNPDCPYRARQEGGYYVEL